METENQVRSSSANHLETITPKQSWGDNDVGNTIRDLEPEEPVWVLDCRNRLRTQWEKGLVMQRLGPTSYVVEVND